MIILIFIGMIIIGLGIFNKVRNKKKDVDKGNFLPFIFCWIGFIIILLSFVLLECLENKTTEHYSYVYFTDKDGNKTSEYRNCDLDLTNGDKYVIIINEDGKEIKINKEGKMICLIK